MTPARARAARAARRTARPPAARSAPPTPGVGRTEGG
jgi:hypothetical protein